MILSALASIRKTLVRREDSLAIQSIILTAARAVGFLTTFLIPIILVRVFNQAEFGTYKQLFLISGTVFPILDLGLYASVFYFVPRDEEGGQRYIIQALAILSISGALGAAGLLLGAESIGRVLNSESIPQYLPLLALFILLYTPTGLVVSIPVVDRRPLLAAWTMAGGDLVRACVIISAALIWRTIEAVLWAMVAIALLRSVWLLIYVRIRGSTPFRRPNLPDIIDQFRYALPFAVAVLFQISLERFHEYYVAAQLSPAEFAIYAVGILHIPVLGMLSQSVVEVMLLRAAEAYKTGNQREMRQVWKKAVERLAAAFIPCWALAELLAPDLIEVLFGAAYAGAVPVLRLFLLSVPLMILVDHGILRATGDTPYLVKANAVGFLVSVVAVVILTRYSVLLGGIGAYLCGILTMRVLGLLCVAQRLDLSLTALLPYRVLVRLGGAAALSAAAASSALSLPHPVLRISVAGLLFAICYGGMVLRWDLVPRKEIDAVLGRFIPSYRWAGSSGNTPS